MKKIIYPLFLFFLLNIGAVRGQSDGSLDLSFDADGMVLTDLGANDERAHAIAIQTDGKIVVAGYTCVGMACDWVILRYNSDGSLDTGFNTNGKVIIDFAGGIDVAWGVAIQSDDKIVVSGVSAGYFAVARLNTDGSLDTSFDTDGLATGAIGTGKGLAIQSDGKIVVVGRAMGASNQDFAAVRFNTDGSLDTLFDGDGKVTTEIGSAVDYAEVVVIQSDGKIVISGYYNIGSFDSDFAVVRYNSDGSLDSTFDADGIVTTDISVNFAYCSGAAVQADGKIVITGYYNDGTINIPIVRYNSNGSLDTTFDTDGIKILAYPYYGSDVAIQSDGKIVIIAQGTSNSLEFVLFRCNSDGSLDTTFDTDGVVVTDFTGSIGRPLGIAIQSDAKIVVVGTANNDIALARYNVLDCDTTIYATLSLCQGDSVYLEGNYQYTSGVYYDSLLSVDSCDSVIATTLNVEPANYFTPDVIICTGDSALIYGTYRTTAGTYFDSLTTVNGCDSIHSTILIVLPLPTVSFSGLDTSYCLVDAVAPLTGSPSGGFFNGIGMFGDLFSPTTAGIGTSTVTYTYIDSNNCTNSASQTVNVNNCTGIENYDFFNSFEIYPNPNTGEFNIELNITQMESFEIIILNNLGQEIFTEKLKQFKGIYEKPFDLNEYPAGVYNLQLVTDKGVIIRQIIIE
ncbi:MAG: T9SS type A sorting domain-containing protein [Flavobacteriales bacterium]|nr:T9SS type A sorting domain-containing protein [Flavobacteriales bacterium]